MTPDLTKSRTTDDGVLVPLGTPTKHESSKMVRALLRSIFTNCIVFQMQVPVWGSNTLFASTCEKNTVVWLQACLRYNDYIVYNVDQIKMRYALHVTFNFNRR
jgi:poly [ADP-ribose] polymerase